ncbi:MAG TPA: glycosyltransferase family 39 protein, partial [Polyangia bacterium]
MAGRGARKGSGKHRNEAPADLEAAAEGAIQGFARKHERWILVGLFVVAVLWRAIYCWAIGRSPFAEDLSVDAAAHHEWARRISEGDLTFGGVFFRAPLYYYVLGGLYWVFGADPDVARVFQILVGAATCLVIHRIAKRVFDPVVAPAVALIAGAMACVYGMYVYFANELLIETLALFLNVSGLALLLSALETPRLRRWFASGLIFGLAAITQPNVLVFVTLALLWNFLRFRAVWGRGPTLQRLSVLVLGLALMIAPVTIYNAVVGGDRVLISSQGGVNLFIGNNPEANGVSAYVPGARLDWNGFLEDTNRIAQRALGNPNAKPSEISAYWAGRAFDFMIEQPAQFLWLTARKVYFFFNAHEAANNRSLRPMTDFSFL